MEINGEHKNESLKSVKESECFEYLVRAQLVPSASRTDVHLSKDEIFGDCFVKGPYLTMKQIEHTGVFYKWKKANSILAVDYYIVKLIPDVFPEGTALGCRNRCDRKLKYPFMVTKSLLKKTDDVKTRVHESKLWPPTVILESDKTWIPETMWSTSPDSVKMDFTMSMIFRMMIGAVDLADKNFVLKDDRLYSIDEDNENIMFVNLFEDKAAWKRYGYKKFEMIWDYLFHNFEKIYAHVQSWSPLIIGEIDLTYQVKQMFDSLKRMSKDEWDTCKMNICSKKLTIEEPKQKEDVIEEKLFVGFRGTTSKHGHGHDVLISAIHKYIRRGDSRKLIYVFSQLMGYLEVPETSQRKSKITNFANRLAISSMEDASTAFHIFPNVANAYVAIKSFNTVKTKGLDWNTENKQKMAEILAKLCIQISKSVKSRIPSAMSNVSYLLDIEKTDKITCSFLKIALELRGKENEYEAIFKKSFKEKTDHCLVLYKKLYDLNSDLVCGKGFIKNMCTILDLKYDIWSSVFFETVKGKKEEFMPGAILLFKYLYGDDYENIQIDDKEVSELVTIFLSDEKMDLDDFVYDKHTSKGSGFEKKMKMTSMERFVLEGSVVNNHSKKPTSLELRKCYEEIRLLRPE